VSSTYHYLHCRRHKEVHRNSHNVGSTDGSWDRLRDLKDDECRTTECKSENLED
jgi:hypothetical protein